MIEISLLIHIWKTIDSHLTRGWFHLFDLHLTWWYWMPFEWHVVMAFGSFLRIPNSDPSMRIDNHLIAIWFACALLIWFWFKFVCFIFDCILCYWLYSWFDLIWFDLIWFDLIWFNLIWVDLIWFHFIWFDLI